MRLFGCLIAGLVAALMAGETAQGQGPGQRLYAKANPAVTKHYYQASHGGPIQAPMSGCCQAPPVQKNHWGGYCGSKGCGGCGTCRPSHLSRLWTGVKTLLHHRSHNCCAPAKGASCGKGVQKDCTQKHAVQKGCTQKAVVQKGCTQKSCTQKCSSCKPKCGWKLPKISFAWLNRCHKPKCGCGAPTLVKGGPVQKGHHVQKSHPVQKGKPVQKSIIPTQKPAQKAELFSPDNPFVDDAVERTSGRGPRLIRPANAPRVIKAPSNRTAAQTKASGVVVPVVYVEEQPAAGQQAPAAKSLRFVPPVGTKR